jgi:hypothetical protein
MQYDASTMEIMTLTMASKVYMRKCLMPNLNSYRYDFKKYDHGRPGKTL